MLVLNLSEESLVLHAFTFRCLRALICSAQLACLESEPYVVHSHGKSSLGTC